MMAVQVLEFWQFWDIVLNWASKPRKLLAEIEKWNEIKQYLSVLYEN